MAQVLGPIQIGISNLIDSRLNESHQFSITDIEYFTVKWINLFYKCTKLRHIYIYSYRHNLIGFERMMKKIKEQKYKSVSDCHCHSLSRHNRVQKNCTGLIESVISTLSHNELDTDCPEVLLVLLMDRLCKQYVLVWITHSACQLARLQHGRRIIRHKWTQVSIDHLPSLPRCLVDQSSHWHARAYILKIQLIILKWNKHNFTNSSPIRECVIQFIDFKTNQFAQFVVCTLPKAI